MDTNTGHSSGFTNDVHAHVFSQIAAAEVHTAPFPHCFVRNVFPSGFYQTLLEALPADARYQKYPPPYESRLYFDLNPPTADGLGEFWREFQAWINGPVFLRGMAEKFSPYVRAVHEYRKELMEQNSAGDFVKIGCRTIVTRDYGDFVLGPHTDSVVKFITAIFYLPKDDEFAEFGTSIYKPKEAGFTAWDSPHFPHDKFDLVRTFPNVPNSLFVFVKTENSFHGVQPGDYPNSGRNMLMWIPEIGKSGRAWGPLWLPRSLLAQ